jgi:hypothetical protein
MLGGTRRGRRRRFAWTSLGGLALVALLAGGAFSGYRVGISQGLVEIERLESDLATLHDMNRLLSERVATAEQQAEAAIARHARLIQEQRRAVPSAEVVQLTELLASRLRDGLPADRLAFVLDNAAPEPHCAPGIDTRRLVVHTPASTSPIASAAFFENRVTITGEGLPTRSSEGTLQPRYDTDQPVTLRFFDIAGGVGTAAGRLPLTHAMMLEGTEFRFAVRPSDRQPDAVEISAQRCAFP